MTKPLFTSWGDTFTNPKGSSGDLHSAVGKGEVEYESLNRRRFVSHVDFGGFYGASRDFVMARLGHPVVRVELTDFQIMTAIDEAISKLDYHAPWWCTQMATFQASAGVNGYEIPQVIANNLQYVVYKKTLLSVALAQNSLEFDFFIKYFQENFLFKDFSVTDFLITTMHLEQIRKILGREGSFQVMDGNRLFVFPSPTENEEVIVEYRALNTQTMHHYFINWVQRFSLAVSKVILGEIRGKYDVLPSPQGGSRLNGEALVQEGIAAQEKLVEELLSEIEEPPVITAF
jgi:hypothetical protein|tara:strand:+ start:2106 stop:2969 length:864 start_codon:yes stop_codon:yes gene_type:complete